MVSPMTELLTPIVETMTSATRLLALMARSAALVAEMVSLMTRLAALVAGVVSPTNNRHYSSVSSDRTTSTDHQNGSFGH